MVSGRESPLFKGDKSSDCEWLSGEPDSARLQLTGQGALDSDSPYIKYTYKSHNIST